MNIKNIALKTFENLELEKKELIPSEYTKEFCKIASEHSIKSFECDSFVNALLELSQEELDINEKNGIYTIYDIVNILLKRPSSSELAKQTSGVSNILKTVDNSISEALKDGTKAYTNIDTIKKEIQKSNNNDDLNMLKNKLINASINVENEINEINNKLKEGHNEVVELSKNIKKLENDLNKYKKESIIDHLTGINTRRYFDNEILKFEEDFTRNNQNFALVFFDLDYFKKINDNYGHDCGDVILKTFAKLLNKLTRKTDILVRFGGEEFVSCVKYKDKKELNLYIKRIKDLVINNKFKYKELKLSITFSAGVALRENNTTYLNTLKISDELVYKAKDNGRNQIVFENGHII